MRVLISGHRGFIGRHMWQALDTPENRLVGVDIEPHSQQDTNCPDRATLYDGRHWQFTDDVRDWFECSSREPFDLVIHAAAIVGGRKTIDGSPLAIATNLALDTALFQWAAKTRPGKVVYMSSSAVYPIRYQEADYYLEGGGLTEGALHPGRDTIHAPDAAYGWCKLSGEKLAAYAAADGLNVLIPRPFSGFGEDQSLDYPFPSFVDRACRRMDPFEIWGDGQQVRDWIHVDDVIGCVLAAVDQDVTGPLNIGTGRPTRFVELADMVTKAAGYSPEFEFHLDAPRGVAYRVADVTRMNQVYTAKVSLEEGIERALERR